MDGIGGVPPRGKHPLNSGSQRPDESPQNGGSKGSEIRHAEAGKPKDLPDHQVDLTAQRLSPTPAESVKPADLESIPTLRQSQDKAEVVSATVHDGTKSQIDAKRIEKAVEKISEAAVRQPAKLLASQGKGLTSEKVFRLIS